MDCALHTLLTEMYPEQPEEVEELTCSLERAIVDARRVGTQTIQRFPLDNTDAVLVAREDSLKGPETQSLRYLYRFLDEICEGVFSYVHILPGASVPSDTQADRSMFVQEFPVISGFCVRDRGTKIPLEELEEILRAFIGQVTGGAGIVRVDSDSAPFVAILGRVARLVDQVLVSPEEANSFTGVHLLYDESLAPVVMDAVTRSDSVRLQECLNDRIRTRLPVEATLPLVNGWNVGGLDVDPNLPASQRARTFLAAHAIMLVVAGVPAIGIYELLFPGSSNDSRDGGHLDYRQVEPMLEDEESPAAIVLHGYQVLLRARVSGAAFHPASPERVAATDPRILAIVRGPWDGEMLVCLHNVSGEPAEFRDRRDKYPWSETGVVRDLLSEDLLFPAQEGALFSLELQPWEVMWLQLGTDVLPDDSIT